MNVKVKICGLNSQQAVDTTIKAGAYMAGFVFYPTSPRNITAVEATALTSAIPPHIKRVGLFVNPTNEQVKSVLENNELDILQLHGDETSERVKSLKELTGLQIIKAIRISSAADLKNATSYSENADWILFDSYAPVNEGGKLPGGNAISFDWNILKNLSFSFKWILAGGLSTENVSKAISVTGASIVDVSSGVENAPGEKSALKIKSFIKAASAG
ncbi:MAG: phosphoribosylanthranilate isomerase [Pseudomonadota bacterium]|nr:phosphoribosylanthranilate isomerase [Pseudomonadota bacterium]